MTVTTEITISAETLWEAIPQWRFDSANPKPKLLPWLNELWSNVAVAVGAIDATPKELLDISRLRGGLHPKESGVAFLCTFETEAQAVEAKLRWDDPS